MTVTVDDLEAVARLGRDDVGGPFEVDDADQYSRERAGLVLDGDGQRHDRLAAQPADQPFADEWLTVVQDRSHVAAIAEVLTRGGGSIGRALQSSVDVDGAQIVQIERGVREPVQIRTHLRPVPRLHQWGRHDRFEQRETQIEEPIRRGRRGHRPLAEVVKGVVAAAVVPPPRQEHAPEQQHHDDRDREDEHAQPRPGGATRGGVEAGGTRPPSAAPTF